jgi:hypothetical protein
MKPPLETTSAKRVAQLIEDAMRDAKTDDERAALEAVRQRIAARSGANDVDAEPTDMDDRDTDVL